MPVQLEPEGIVRRYAQALLEKSADQLADLYAEDGVHELPFTHSADGILRGREAIRSRYAAIWAAIPIKAKGIQNLVVHRAVDGATTIAEFDVALIHAVTGVEFEVSTVLVMRLIRGEIAHMRDYTDNLTIAAVLALAGKPTPSHKS